MNKSSENQSPSPKMILFVLMVVVVCIVGTALLLNYLGMFSGVKVSQRDAPAYRIAYLNHTGPYNTIKDTAEKVAQILADANINLGPASALLLDDPSTVDERKLQSKVGYLVNALDYLPSELLVEELPSRKVVQATFEGSPVVGSFKSYSAMKEWAEVKNYTLNLPALEIYYPSGKVEYQLVITRK